MKKNVCIGIKSPLEIIAKWIEWVEVYEVSRASEKRSFLIAIKFKTMSQIKISDDCQ